MGYWEDFARAYGDIHSFYARHPEKLPPHLKMRETEETEQTASRGMSRAAFIRAALADGSPGFDGYTYRADIYCPVCGEAIIREIAPDVAPTLSGDDDCLFRDSETVPQPIFFGESDTARHCGECGEYLYGTQETEESETDNV